MTGRTVGGRYRLARELGRGAMGCVWLAVDTQLQRNVAVKIMTGEGVASPGSRRLFAREALAIAQLASPHVVQVHDSGIDDDVPFIVMELLLGEDLEARLSRQPRLPLAAIGSLLCQAAKALELAHRVGIVHRDLKPANVFLSRAGADEVLKLLDFGVASWAEADGPDRSESLYVLGTPLYLSPEQAWGSAPVDHRSDLWSLGVIAYRALTGVLPFSGRTAGEALVNIYSKPAPPPSALVPGLGGAVDRFFEQALARDPGRRFQSAARMAAAFQKLVDDDTLGKRAKILVVDDEPDVAALVGQHFRDKIRSGDYEFVFAADGAEALDRLREHPDLDVALTDLHMPGMGGLTFLEHAGEINPILRTVVVSAYGDMANVRKAMNRGAFDFLVKPIDLDDLEVTVERTLKHVASARKAAQSTEENSLLEMVLAGGAIDRLLPGLRRIGAPSGQIIEAAVAFVGAVGLDAASRLTPEDAALLLNAHVEVILSEVARRGGAVDRFLGSAAMVLFTGPDRVTLAIESCLAIRRRLDLVAGRMGEASPYACGVSMGVDAGQVLAASLGSGHVARLDHTVLGAAVGNAVRLHAAARPGQILVTETVRGVLGGEYECVACIPEAGYDVLQPQYGSGLPVQEEMMKRR